MQIFGLEVSSEIFHYTVFPLLIFIARILDVSLGTIRIIMVSRGNRALAAFLGFFEVIIWLVAVAQVIQNLNNVVSYLAYGAGFAAGNFIGISIENRLAMGMQAIQIITDENMKTLSMILREEGFGVTNIAANGLKGQIDFIYLVSPRKRTKEVLNIVDNFDKNAFVSVSDIRSAHAGYFGTKSKTAWWPSGIVKKK